MTSDVARDDLLLRLAQHRTLGAAPSEELAWLAANGLPRSYRVGDVTTHKGHAEEWLQVVLAGRLAIRADRGAGSRKVIEWRGGDVCGLMPYSRGGSPPGDTVAEEATDTLAVHRDRLAEMIRVCPRVTAVLVHAMLDRARHFTTSDLHDEKLVSLGKLAAGLAHELNNPASAAVRAVKVLASSLSDADAAASALEAAQLSESQRTRLGQVRAACLVPRAAARSSLERADRVEAIAACLEAHGLDDDVAATLADTDVTLEALEMLAREIPAGALHAAVRSIAGACVVRALTSEIDTSVARIHELVAAVKSFTFVDRARTPEATDIGRGITDTFAVLSAKIRDKSVGVEVRIPNDLPHVLAFGGELNQVWLNLIDNALDAVGASGRIEVSAAREQSRVVIRVVDDGAGIPREIQDRIFDPFFTTKGVGQGTGLGLDIVRRLVQRHDGEIDVTSRPGLTEFRVSLPIVSPG